MVSIASPSIAGILNSQQRVNKAASNIAQADTPQGEGTNIDREIVDVNVARNDFVANSAVLGVQKELSETLIDVVA